MQTQYSSETKDLLTDLDIESVLVIAGKGRRLINFIIDTVMVCALAFILLVILAILFPVWYDTTTNEDNDSIPFLSLVYLITVILYYTVLEAGTKGYTLGKLISGSRVIGTDGKPVSWKSAFLRSLIRLIPFEFLSGLQSRVLHDQWTNTSVVKK